MLDYTGIRCPICGVPFKADDDIVVCPECGAPYHRECYQKAGHCIFEDLHKEGKAWEPPAPPRAPDVSAEIKDVECPICGTLNAHSALFCSRCGASLLGNPEQHKPSGSAYAPPRQVQPPPPAYNPGTQGQYIPFDPMGGVSPADYLDAGVTFGDASQLVRQNTGYYMPVFRMMKQTGRNRFNFSAFLFSGAWMLFRKQYKKGAIVMGLNVLFYLGYLITSLFVTAPVLTDLMTQAGVDPYGTAAMTNDQMIVLSRLMMEDPMNIFLLFLPFLFLIGILVVMIVVGVRGNKMYMRHVVETVRKVRANQGDGDPDMTLSARGGVNVAVAVSIGVAYFLISNFLPLFLV